MRKFLKPFSFLPALLLMYMIYSFSAQEGETSAALSYKVSYTIVETADHVLDAGLEDWEMQSLANRFHSVTRKIAHMTEYFALAVAVSFPLYVYGLHGIWLMLAAGFICVGFACGDEYHQSFVSGRTPSAKDVLIDSFGVFWGVILVRIIGWAGRKTIFRPVRKKKRRVDSYENYDGYDNYDRRHYNEYPSDAYNDRPYGNRTVAPYDERAYSNPSPAPYDERAYSNPSPAPYHDRAYSNPSPAPYHERTYSNEADFASSAYYDEGYYDNQNAPRYGGAYRDDHYDNYSNYDNYEDYNNYSDYDGYDAPHGNRRYPSAPRPGESGYRRQQYPSYHDAGYTHQEVKEAHVSDKLSADMSFKKLMHDIKEQRKEGKKNE